jgi:hypothetical protein
VTAQRHEAGSQSFACEIGPERVTLSIFNIKFLAKMTAGAFSALVVSFSELLQNYAAVHVRSIRYQAAARGGIEQDRTFHQRPARPAGAGRPGG